MKAELGWGLPLHLHRWKGIGWQFEPWVSWLQCSLFSCPICFWRPCSNCRDSRMDFACIHTLNLRWPVGKPRVKGTEGSWIWSAGSCGEWSCLRERPKHPWPPEERNGRGLFLENEEYDIFSNLLSHYKPWFLACKEEMETVPHRVLRLNEIPYRAWL